MAALVTDQFRINNAGNFLGDITDPNNSYYIFLGLVNPGIQSAYGRKTDWDSSPQSPIDNINYENHVTDTMIFGKKITPANARRVVKKRTWTQGSRYEMYRHDYSISNPSPLTDKSKLYDASYFIVNKDYNVYICIDNGSTGISTISKEGQPSQNEPLFTGLEASRASGTNDDGYIWKFLFSVSPSDIIKFDSTEYIPLPNDWSSTSDSQIVSVRENSDSDVNNNQIKKVWIDNPGSGYPDITGQEFNIVGDGSSGKVNIDVVNSSIDNIVVSSGGQGYTYGVVDLSGISTAPLAASPPTPAKLIPIIPPTKGHGYDVYQELGGDKVMVYARFDDSTKDFPIDTKFAQIGIIKNPTAVGSSSTFTESQFSSVGALYLDAPSGSIAPGDRIYQDIKSGSVSIGTAYGYVVSYDVITSGVSTSAVLKYYQDRSLYFNPESGDQTDFANITRLGNQSTGQIYSFQSTTEQIKKIGGGFSSGIETSFNGISTNPTGNKIIDLGVEFNSGIALAEINKGSGEIIYLDNRKLINRDPRQKEDVKIILEF